MVLDEVQALPLPINLAAKSALHFSGVINRRETDIQALHSGETGNRFPYSEVANSLPKASLG